MLSGRRWLLRGEKVSFETFSPHWIPGIPGNPGNVNFSRHFHGLAIPVKNLTGFFLICSIGSVGLETDRTV